MCFLHLEGTSLPVFIHVPIKTCMFVRNSKIKPHASSSNLDLRSSTSNIFVIILNSFKTNTCKAMDKCVEYSWSYCTSCTIGTKGSGARQLQQPAYKLSCGASHITKN